MKRISLLLVAVAAAAGVVAWARTPAGANARSAPQGAAEPTPRSAKEVRGASAYGELTNEPPPKLFVDDPLPEGLAQGIVWIQWRVENLRVVPVFGKGALNVSPRVGHLHVHVDDVGWWWADASDINTIDIAGLSEGPHKVRLELVNPNHEPFPGQSRTVTFTIPKGAPLSLSAAEGRGGFAAKSRRGSRSSCRPGGRPTGKRTDKFHKGEQTMTGLKKAQVDMKLEVVMIGVSDVDRAKAFYQKLGWRFDGDFTVGDDFRVVQMTPHNSGASIIFGKGIRSASPGLADSLVLAVDDLDAARQELLARGVDVSEVFHYAGGPFNDTGENPRVGGRDPEGRSYFSFASFSDPDGNPVGAC